MKEKNTNFHKYLAFYLNSVIERMKTFIDRDINVFLFAELRRTFKKLRTRKRYYLKARFSCITMFHHLLTYLIAASANYICRSFHRHVREREFSYKFGKKYQMARMNQLYYIKYFNVFT